MATAARRAAWKRQRADTRNSQLIRAAWRENTRYHRVCSDAYERFLGRHVQGMEEDLRQRDQRGLFQHCKSLNIEDTRKVNSQYNCDEEGILLRDSGLVLGRWARSFGTLLNGRSLSWMGLTREKWCCTGRQWSRLDMNTCQTSIKTDILFSVAVVHILGLSNQHKITIWFPPN